MRGWRGSKACATVGYGDHLLPGGVPRVRIELLGERTADAYSAPLRDGQPGTFN
ncbi:MAG: hypothetical protein OXQ31_00880 [Spirochaetaceae bacterium]|nr:hypothetical protein [Spirochaetaceae bacterium]